MATSSVSFAPTHLRCEHAVNPLGIDEPRPRLSWWIQDPAAPRGAAQTAYQILVASAADKLAADEGDVWDSGRVASDQSVLVEYGGAKLLSRGRYCWKVRFWNAAGEPSQWSEAAWWEMGLLASSQWKAKWIGSTLVGGKQASVPAPYVRTSFTLKAKPASARLYITALGIYEASINGKVVGDHVFAPGWTEYNHRVMYQTWDVTAMLAKGKNALGAILGDGWYCGHVGPVGRQIYGDRPRLFAQLEVRYADGTQETVVSDGSWKTSAGPILMGDLLMGETYDARYELGRWDSAACDDSKWLPAVEFAAPQAKLVANVGPRVKRIQELKPVSTWSPRRGVYIFDFGQNLVGRVRLRLSALREGEIITLRHAEMLSPDGTLYTENLRSAKATDSYTAAAKGPFDWEPRFTFHGFRYLEITRASRAAWEGPNADPAGAPGAEPVTAVVLHSDTPPSGQFQCSHALVNQLQHNIVWGQKGNFLEVPTDCPQRDERLGWTGDIQVFIRTACFNMDVAGFMTKWLRDLEDSQGPAGAYPIVAPDVLNSAGKHASAAWSDAGVICPWTLYLCYGDQRILERHYEGMVRFIECMKKEAGPGLIRPSAGFGDWLNVDAFTPLEMISTAYFAHSTDLVSRIAKVLGKEDDARRYRKLFEDIRAAFQREFLTATGRIYSGTQTGYIMALRFDLLPEAMRPVAVANLIEDIHHGHSAVWPYPCRGGKLSTGFIGCKHINLALTEGGRTDEAYKLLLNEEYPSWLFPVRNGATTIWERWDGWTPEKGFQTPSMNSFNHYAYGAVGEWMYSVIAGIDLDESQPGFKHVIVHPRVGGAFTEASVALDSPYGRIESHWRIVGGEGSEGGERGLPQKARQATAPKRFQLEVTIPPNTTATVYLPAPAKAGKGKAAGAAGSATESGRPLAEADGVSDIRTEGGELVFRAAAGTYRLECEMK